MFSCHIYLPPPTPHTHTHVVASTAGAVVEHILGCRDYSAGMSVYLDRFWMVEGNKEGKISLWDIRRIKDTPPTVQHSKSSKFFL